MYALSFSKNALKSLTRMPRNLGYRIEEKLQKLAIDPFAPNPNAAKLQGRDGYRLRVGDWRIIYEINDKQLEILVLDIDSRGSIYQ
jgi:mRNA interferase RelE/StbE